MSWNEVTITQSGERILSRMLNGTKLIFTRVVIGSETVNEQALPAQTAVFSPIDVPALIAGKTEIEGKNGTQIKIQIRNDGVTETTRMKQIGLYAKTEHDDEVLFGILQDDIGEEIPTFADFSQFLIELWAVIAISRTNNIQVVVNPTVYATIADLQELEDRIKSDLTPDELPAKVEEAADKAEQALTTANELKQKMAQINPSRITSQNIIIPTTGWAECPAEEYDGIYVDVPIEGVTASMIPMVSIIPADEKKAKPCGFGGTPSTMDGYLRIYAQNAPTEPIGASVALISPSATTVSGELLPATAARLGGVKIGDGLNVTDDGTISVSSENLVKEIAASEDEGSDIINKYFGNTSN